MNTSAKETSALGGRLPLLNPGDLSADQKSVYDLIMKQFVPALKGGNLESATSDGRLIGPYNPLLYIDRKSVV